MVNVQLEMLWKVQFPATFTVNRKR